MITNFFLVFACICVIIFGGSFVILFWFELIKNKIIITKKKNRLLDRNDRLKDRKDRKDKLLNIVLASCDVD